MANTKKKTVEAEETTSVEVTKKVETVNLEVPTDTEETISQTVDSVPKTGDVIEVEWESLEHIFEFRNKLINLENYFSNMCLQFEKNKANIMSQITYGENDLYGMAKTLQNSMNVSSELMYELKLPSNPGEKGYFIRKDEQQ